MTMRSFTQTSLFLCGWLAVVHSLPAQDRPDIVVADFEATTYGEWKTTGEAFGPGPAQGTLPNQMPVTGYRGERLVNSYLRGDGTTGTLTSPAVKLERKYVNFLIGGGEHPGETCINLKIGDQVVRTASGPNDRPGGSEALDWHTWDVAEFAGKTAVLEIVDKHTGGWGHVNIDHIVQSDRKLQAQPARRTLTIDKPYLLLPVQRSGAARKMTLSVDNQTVRELDIHLPEGKPDFQVFADVSKWKGMSLTITVDRLPADSKVLETIVGSDTLPDAAGLYQEKHRPQFHFTARRGWLNDPNGLVYFDGQYHLFFQHNPYGWPWGNMHWGHAVSPDLVHWKELPLAIIPRQYGDWAFSGSAVVDKDNTTGLGEPGKPVLVAAFTSTGRGECLVFSKDRGRTWTEFPNNPVVKHAGRDPRLVWHAPTKSWVMAIYDEAEGKRWIVFHTSPDMQTWTYRSRVEGFFECPELFEIPIEGQPGQSRWVLYGADGEYVLGQFDGQEFHSDLKRQRIWHGQFYAAQTWSDSPDGRRIQIGWANGTAFPGMPFNQQMTVPHTLTLRDAGGLQLTVTPVKELESLRDKPLANIAKVELTGDEDPLKGADAELVDLELQIEPRQAKAVVLNLRGVPVEYEVASQILSIGSHKLKVPLEEGKLHLRALVDRGSIELFAQHGKTAVSHAVILPVDNRRLSLSVKDGTAFVNSLDVYPLRSAWAPVTK